MKKLLFAVGIFSATLALGAPTSAPNGGTNASNPPGTSHSWGGNITFTGAYNTQFIIQGNTVLTLPTSGTLIAAASSLTDGSVLFIESNQLTESNGGLFWNTLNDRLGVGVNFNLTPPASTLHIRDNNSTGGVNNGATVEQAGSGDAVYHAYLNATGRQYTWGIDQSDGEKYKVSVGANLGTNDAYSIEPSTQIVTFNQPISGSITGNSGGVTSGYVSSITGSTNQVLANGTVGTPQTGAVTLTLPQFLGTSSTPTFGGVTLDGSGSVVNIKDNTVSSGQSFGTLNWLGLTSTSAPAFYARFLPTIVSNTNGAMTSKLTGSVQQGGILTSYFDLDGSTQLVDFFKPLALSTPLALSSGGLNASLVANDGGVFYSTSSAAAILSGTATAGKALQSGANAAPSWSPYALPTSTGSAGKIFRSDGTNIANSTSTFADTYAASSILFSNGANTVTGLATANNGVLATNGSGVPSITSTLPSAVQSNITALGALAALDASSVVVTDGSKNLTTVASAGSYTPTIGDGTNNFTTSSAVGTYFKIGHVYLCQIDIVWTGKGSASAGSHAVISFPATVGANSVRSTLSFGYTQGVGFTGSYLTGVANNGNNKAELFGVSNAGAINFVLVSQLASGGQIQANFFFWDN